MSVGQDQVLGTEELKRRVADMEHLVPESMRVHHAEPETLQTMVADSLHLAQNRDLDILLGQIPESIDWPAFSFCCGGSKP